MEAIDRRMSVLFLLLMGLIAWQAPRTRPLDPPRLVSVTRAGEQVFPIAVPAGEAPRPPSDLAARLAFLQERSVDGIQAAPQAGCEIFVRVSPHHWLRLQEPAGRLAGLRAGGPTADPSSGAFHRTFYLAGADLLDDDDGDGDPLDERELRSSGPGADVEAFCRP